MSFLFDAGCRWRGVAEVRRWPALTAGLFTGLALIAQSDGPSSAQAAQGAPQIVSTSPARGASDVDPALNEITVTFDQDMGGGMSWTGGGPEFPHTPEGQRGIGATNAHASCR
jgi:hypothetical protein